MWNRDTDTDYSIYYGRNTNVFYHTNEKTSGILTGISTHNGNTSVLLYIHNCNHTITSNLIDKIEVDMSNELMPTITDLCDRRIVLDISNRILSFMNPFIEI